ncbi:MAG TPA: hypothetical protein VGP43_07940 [Chitinophagaceae bacterium]|nr:hypothetical protein [Chitinophagaceae bacterium]
MKTKILLLSIFLFSGFVFAQSGNSYKSKKIVKQQSKAKARSHANSNSVFGPGNIHPKYIKKSPPKKVEIVKEKIKEEGESKKTKTKEKK